jgi:hypothetical protein
MPPLPESGIMRVNSGHDSNIERELVIAETEQYKHRFFNTSIPRFDFPAPVVLTANPQEEERWHRPPTPVPPNVMFVRLRTSGTNLHLVRKAASAWTFLGVPIVLTFMAYYTGEPTAYPHVTESIEGPAYTWKQRHINSYWCPTPAFMQYALALVRDTAAVIPRLVTMCGSLESGYCKDCRSCETYYWQTLKRMKGE